MEILPCSEVLSRWATHCGVEETCPDILERAYTIAFHGKSVTDYPDETYASFFLRDGEVWDETLDNTDSAAFRIAIRKART